MHRKSNVSNQKGILALEIANVGQSEFCSLIKENLNVDDSKNEFSLGDQVENEIAKSLQFSENEDGKIEDNFLPSTPSTLPDISKCSKFDDIKYDSMLETSTITLQTKFSNYSIETNEKEKELIIQDDDFGDFTNFSEHTQFEKLDQTDVPDKKDKDDDFGDFNDFEPVFEQPVVEQSEISLKESICRIENKSVSFLIDLFP